MTNQKTQTLILVLMMMLLASPSVPPTFALPSSRSLKSITHHRSSQQHQQYHGFQKREYLDVDTADYSGTGANPHHDPRSPPGTL